MPYSVPGEKKLHVWSLEAVPSKSGRQARPAVVRGYARHGSCDYCPFDEVSFFYEINYKATRENRKGEEKEKS
jgi:hypothetical protein